VSSLTNLRLLILGGRSTATAWLCAPSPAEDTGVEIFNEGPGSLEVVQAVSHAVETVNRLPWKRDA